MQLSYTLSKKENLKMHPVPEEPGMGDTVAEERNEKEINDCSHADVLPSNEDSLIKAGSQYLEHLR